LFRDGKEERERVTKVNDVYFNENVLKHSLRKALDYFFQLFLVNVKVELLFVYTRMWGYFFIYQILAILLVVYTNVCFQIKKKDQFNIWTKLNKSSFLFLTQAAISRRQKQFLSLEKTWILSPLKASNINYNSMAINHVYQ
jgi:hypothetical protein